MNTEPQYYVQYHNADNLQEYPADDLDFNIEIKNIELNDEPIKQSWIYTRKKSVLKAIGSRCFLIVGKTENKIKNYYLWASFIIENYKLEYEDFIDIEGTGNDFKKPLLLNNLVGFSDFKKFCGNFGLGFLNISNNVFTKTLIDCLNAGEQTNNDNNITDYFKQLEYFNQKMQEISPKRQLLEINKLLRNDSEIINLYKKIYDYKCQFPGCNSKIVTKNGNNYVEVAHIRPVKNGGQSIIGNLVVLCPNHHKEFDFGHLEIIEQNETVLTGNLNCKKFAIKFKQNGGYC